MLFISRNYLSLIENGHKIPSERVIRRIGELESGLGLNNQKNIEKFENIENIDLISIPVISWAKAGEATTYYEIPSEWQKRISIPPGCPDESSFGIEIKGDSMEPKFSEGDIVVVMPNIRPKNGCLVIARLKNDGVMFKRFFYSEDQNKIELRSYNPAYAPMIFSGEDFSWIYPVFSVHKDLWH